jgi:hypothetical protein
VLTYQLLERVARHLRRDAHGVVAPCADPEQFSDKALVAYDAAVEQPTKEDE